MVFKKIKTSLPLNRLIIYLMVIGLIPLGCIFYHYVSAARGWEEISAYIASIQQLADNQARKQQLNKTVKNVYLEADQFYLENQLESLCFLKKERETLEQLLRSPAFTGNEGAEKRYAQLSSKTNRLQWLQGSVQAAEGMQEVTCLMAHPVEIDSHDLKEILNRVEGNRKGKPQLLIQDFKLTKKIQINGNEVFELSMKLLKREFNV